MHVSNARKPEAVKAAIALMESEGVSAYHAAKMYGIARSNITRTMHRKEDAKSKDPIIVARYPTENTRTLAKELDWSISYLNKRAAAIGVKKCRDFLAKQQSEAAKNSTTFGFKRGNKHACNKSPEARKLRATLTGNIQALADTGNVMLAKMTEDILKQINKVLKNGRFEFDFLTIRDER